MADKKTSESVKKTLIEFTVLTFFVLISFFAVAVIIEHATRVPFPAAAKTIFRELPSLFKYTGVNQLIYKDLLYDLHVTVYCVIALSFTLAFVLRRLTVKKKTIFRVPPLAVTFPRIILIVICLLSALRLIEHQETFTKIFYLYDNKPDEHKLAVREPFPYHFSQFCKKMLPGRHTGDFITDYDMDKFGEAVLLQRKLSYFLYPEINLRIRKNKPAECVVVISKNDAKKLVPENYRVIGQYSKDALIAVRKNLPK